MCIYVYAFTYAYIEMYSQVNMMEDCICILCRDTGLSPPMHLFSPLGCKV